MTVNLTRFPELRQAEIKALLESGYSIKKCAAIARCSIETVIAVKRSDKFDRSIVDAIKNKISGKFYRIADSSLDAITPDKFKNASIVQLVTAAGISVDKARLIDGDATQRVEFVGVNDGQLEAEMAELQAELAAWESGQTVNASVDAPQATDPASEQAA